MAVAVIGQFSHDVIETQIKIHQSMTWVSTANNIMAKLTDDSNN